MHKCNKIVCTNIMAYWGCLKIFTSDNDSFRHQVNQIPMFDVWAFKDALFAHFHSTNSVILDQLLTDFQLMKLKPGQPPLSFISIVEARAEELTDCGHNDISDMIMKTRIYRGLTGCQTLQDFLFTYDQDPSINYFKFREALKLRAETFTALLSLTMTMGGSEVAMMMVILGRCMARRTPPRLRSKAKPMSLRVNHRRTSTNIRLRNYHRSMGVRSNGRGMALTVAGVAI